MSPVPAPAESKKPWTIREIIIVGGAALTLISFVKDVTDLLDWVERIVAGYRQFYSSIWRSVTSPLPNWLKPYDAPQTYDALMFLSLIASTLIGSQHMTSRGRLLDAGAACVLSLLFQIITIRLWDRSLYDTVVTTTVNMAIMGICFVAACVAFWKPKQFPAAFQWAPLSVAASTLLIMFITDSPALLRDVLFDTLPPELGLDLGQARHIFWTALILTIVGLAVYLGYAFRGPRRPLVAWALGIAAVIFAISLAGGIIERAMRDAGWVAGEAPPVPAR